MSFSKIVQFICLLPSEIILFWKSSSAWPLRFHPPPAQSQPNIQHDIPAALDGFLSAAPSGQHLSPHSLAILASTNSDLYFLNSVKLPSSVWFCISCTTEWKIPPGKKLSQFEGMTFSYCPSQGSQSHAIIWERAVSNCLP